MILLTTIGPHSSGLWVALLSALAGLSVVSWNGVFLAGLAEAAEGDRVSEVTAAGTFVLFAGYVVSPLSMQLSFVLTDSYSFGLTMFGLVPILVSLLYAARILRRN